MNDYLIDTAKEELLKKPKKKKIQNDYMPYLLGDGTYDIKDDTGEIVRSTPKANKNEPCACGSGKKYKHCCLNK